MTRVFSTILETIGRTPLVEIRKMAPAGTRILAKVEYFNPGSSVKDRVALAMIEAAERDGRLAAGGTIIEPTSGNTGIGLAMAAAVRGYRMILVMPDSMSLERRRLAAAYGAEIVLTPGAEGMAGCIAKANSLQQEIPGAFIPMQFDNFSNPEAHYLTTGPEIWADTDGKADAFVATVGTGGTFTGTARYLREKNPALGAYAVEPAESPLLSGGQAAPHRIQGIGANFIPKVMDALLATEILTVNADDAGECARRCAASEGILIGISGGAALHAAIRLAERPEFQGKTIVVILPDCGERYLSTWLFDNGK